ncbi:MAG: DNA adenine methylase [Oscillospiraceae bacterium]|nr:DNA adenine methylase [Oscillospiraceae bacterium]
MLQSPLNYTGGKFRLLPQILPLFPDDIDTFVDLFCGGCNVGINVKARKHMYNDTNRHLISLYDILKNNNKKSTLATIYAIIEKYNLSLVSKYGYDYYDCNSSNGIGKYNKDKFLKMREDFNCSTKKDDYYYLLLYVMIVYSFNNQIRFNSNGAFNLPVGKRDFNKKMENKLIAFIDMIKAQDSHFSCLDFNNFDISALTEKDFVYIDPPYLITCAAYNEQDGWNIEKEKQLLTFIDRLTKLKIRCALSNVLKSKGKENTLLIEWIEKNKKTYTVHYLNYSYANSNYHTKDKSDSTQEVLITNYHRK